MGTSWFYSTFCAITCLFWKKRIRVVEEERDLLIYIFYWFGRTRSFAYVPMRDQNLVVRGKNWRLICFCVFYWFWKKVLKWKAKWQNEFVCVFYIKGKWLEIWLRLIAILIYERIKIKRSLDLRSRFIVKNVFCDFVICMFLLFFPLKYN